MKPFCRSSGIAPPVLGTRRILVAITFAWVAGFLALAAPLKAQSAASNVNAQDVEGVTHFRRLGTTVACGGATTPAAVAEIKKMGFVADINFRRPSEPGANVEGEGAAAKAAGLRYYNI
ncbi:MAG: hypothetical protein KGL02_09000, partial [Acidobacteriota bacterium]|nr:hypothetical protein [Acidobacteriota bacterium]